jgi:hypothetical protein
MIGEKYFHLAGVPPERFMECLEWAFGKIDPSETLKDLIPRWNAKHHYIFTVSEKDNAKAFLWSVGKAFMDHEFDHARIIVPGGRLD